MVVALAFSASLPYTSNKIFAFCLLLQAYHDYLAFLLMVNEAVKGKKISDDFPVSEVGVTCIVNVRRMYICVHVHLTVGFYAYL